MRYVFIKSISGEEPRAEYHAAARMPIAHMIFQIHGEQGKSAAKYSTVPMDWKSAESTGTRDFDLKVIYG